MLELKGVVPALTTPFDEDEGLDLAGLRKLIDLVIDDGVHGVLVNGCTGESWALQDEERFEVFQTAADQASGRLPVTAGCGATSARKAIFKAHQAERAGCDAIMIQPPWYVLPGEEEIEDYYLSVGQLYHEHRSYKKARGILKEGLDHHPDSQSLTFHLGSVFERLNDIDAAERQFQRVLAADPQHAAALNYLGYMLADHELRLDEALGYIERALDQDPHNGAYLDSLGWAYFKLNKLELAEKSLVLAIQINEGDPTILEHLGDLYVRKGDRSSALDCYRKSVAAAEDPGELRKVQGKLTALEKEFRRAGRHREPNR